VRERTRLGKPAELEADRRTVRDELECADLVSDGGSLGTVEKLLRLGLASECQRGPRGLEQGFSALDRVLRPICDERPAGERLLVAC
jgi:hypothetical protein